MATRRRTTGQVARDSTGRLVPSPGLVWHHTQRMVGITLSSYPAQSTGEHCLVVRDLSEGTQHPTNVICSVRLPEDDSVALAEEMISAVMAILARRGLISTQEAPHTADG